MIRLEPAILTLTVALLLGMAGAGPPVATPRQSDDSRSLPLNVRFRLADGVSFVHVALIEEEGRNPLADMPAFQEFQREIGDRCDEPPAAQDATVVGSYRFFAESSSR